MNNEVSYRGVNSENDCKEVDVERVRRRDVNIDCVYNELIDV